VLVIVEEVRVGGVRAPCRREPAIGDRRVPETELDEAAVERVTGAVPSAPGGELAFERAELRGRRRQPALLEGGEPRAERTAARRPSERQNPAKEPTDAHCLGVGPRRAELRAGGEAIRWHEKFDRNGAGGPGDVAE